MGLPTLTFLGVIASYEWSFRGFPTLLLVSHLGYLGIPRYLGHSIGISGDPSNPSWLIRGGHGLHMYYTLVYFFSMWIPALLIVSFLGLFGIFRVPKVPLFGMPSHHEGL